MSDKDKVNPSDGGGDENDTTDKQGAGAQSTSDSEPDDDIKTPEFELLTEGYDPKLISKRESETEGDKKKE